jgi:hypothetical protein
MHRVGLYSIVAEQHYIIAAPAAPIPAYYSVFSFFIFIHF